MIFKEKFHEWLNITIIIYMILLASVQRHTQNSDGKASNQQKFKLFNAYVNRIAGKNGKSITMNKLIYLRFCVNNYK